MSYRQAEAGSAGKGREASTDLDLLARARRGDAKAFEMLAARLGPGLYRLAYSLVSNAADAEDVLQETFLAAYTRMHAFKRLSSVATWMTAILVRQASRLRRRRSVRRTETLEAAEGVGSPAPPGELRLDLAEALDGLSKEHREVIALREVQGLSYDEIADVLGVPRGTVESRLHRARRALRDRLGDYLR